MRNSATTLVGIMFLGVFAYHLSQSGLLDQRPAGETRFEKELLRVSAPQVGVEHLARVEKPPVKESDLDREIRRAMEDGVTLEERKRHIAAIAASFARRTDPERARRLAVLCYVKTLGTPFSPMDIAEIALAETGSFGLSGTKVSPMGARGVWQVMPGRAKSHGYAPKEMENDQKCADAAVRELTAKLAMAHGNLTRAKKLYCGVGRQADAYEVVRRQYRREIMAELNDVTTIHGGIAPASGPPLPLYATLVTR